MCRAEFNFEENANGELMELTTYDLDPSVFATCLDLDCTLVGVRFSSGKNPLANWGTLQIDTNAVLSKGDHVSIIQHPQGGPKQICATMNQIVNFFEHKIHYTTDTLPGSSGSPVFNDEWKVVGLHRAGGNMQANKGGATIFANEGVLFSAVMKEPRFLSIIARA